MSDVSPFGFTTHTQFQVFLLDVEVRLCLVIVNSGCSPNSCIFHIAKTGSLRCYTLSTSQENMIQERCWISQIDFFIEYFSTSDQCYVSFQPITCHPHTQIRITLFHYVQRDIPNLEFSPSHASIGFSQIAFPIIVLPKDDRTDSFQEERLDLPCWTMI